jgi:hypothetical protein
VKISESQTVYTIKDDLITEAKSHEAHRITLSMEQAIASDVSMT